MDSEEKPEEKKNEHKDVTFSYDGNAYVVSNHLRVRRYLAEHALKKGYNIAQGRNMLKIEELPYEERSAELYPEANEALRKENQKLQKESEQKDVIIQKLEAELAETEKKKKK